MRTDGELPLTSRQLPGVGHKGEIRDNNVRVRWSVERPAGPDLVYLRELRSDTFMGEAV